MIKFLLIGALFVNYGASLGSVSHSIEKFDTEDECRAALKVAIYEMETKFPESSGILSGKTGFEGQCKPYYFDK
ncbi:hypothetical protein phiAS5_ORF0314 [Aeromonas phage phiAS5]|uniref:Uncharacterized protein n=1 Tax=Aeromonas phage phiAS5 TaxID=879630 RepID=E1A268_9CAUD|nr:hypothetical protein phiAS5_ORF0314 [Aeromonas phage phiAS5]ADM80157.1 hypothetical protein phiAS5_ORF0314 [Aeromonas phage phiAS5]